MIASPLGSLFFHTSLNNQTAILAIMENRQRLAEKYGCSDYHEYLLLKSPRKIFNFQAEPSKSIETIYSWLYLASKINKSIMRDFTQRIGFYLKFVKEHDLRFITNMYIHQELSCNFLILCNFHLMRKFLYTLNMFSILKIKNIIRNQ